MTADLQILNTLEGISFYHQGAAEAQWVYDEIFGERCYDIAKVSEKPLIIDAGANIGLYTLFAKKNYPDAQVLAFEPAAETVNILKQNVALHELSGVEIYDCALGSKNETKILTFYPNTPSNTTLFNDEKKDWLDLIADKISPEVAERMGHGARQTPVSVKRLSDFLRGRKNLARIDMLKIDVEGGELDVINGLDDEHLLLVQNIVMEVWNSNGQLEIIEKALQAKGFITEATLVPWKTEGAESMKMYMLTARRASNDD
ncbi:hypothetical protein HG530_012570 [Fusarium avenaceum]|nr:hypothetical protein HG530_012570 [Fusarium avenaceum]